MTYDELLVEIKEAVRYTGTAELFNQGGWLAGAKALLAVVELMKEKQDWLEKTSVDVPMTNESLFRREERWSLLAEFKSAIEKELK